MNAHDILPTIGKTSQLVYVDTMRNRWDWARPADEAIFEMERHAALQKCTLTNNGARLEACLLMDSTSPNGMCSR